MTDRSPNGRPPTIPITPDRRSDIGEWRTLAADRLAAIGTDTTDRTAQLVAEHLADQTAEHRSPEHPIAERPNADRPERRRFLFGRRAPIAAADRVELRSAELRADIERTRALAELRREQAAADRAAKRDRAAERAAEREARRKARRSRYATLAGKARLVGPLLIVNGAAIYGQVAYAYEKVSPAPWPAPGRAALAVVFAAAIESIAVYVGWHAHDALLKKATATAAKLRRASYLVAAVVAAMNYAHFAGKHMAPTAAAVGFGLLSVVSPWLWGLHTRRAQHVQLLDEGQVDCTGAVFSAERRRAFPIRSRMASRWSIDHNVTNPAAAWGGYNRDRRRRQAEVPSDRLRAALAVLSGRSVASAREVPIAPNTVRPDRRSGVRADRPKRRWWRRGPIADHPQPEHEPIALPDAERSDEPNTEHPIDADGEHPIRAARRSPKRLASPNTVASSDPIAERIKEAFGDWETNTPSARAIAKELGVSPSTGYGYQQRLIKATQANRTTDAEEASA